MEGGPYGHQIELAGYHHGNRRSLHGEHHKHQCVSRHLCDQRPDGVSNAITQMGYVYENARRDIRKL